MKKLNRKEVVEKSRETWAASGFCHELFAWKNFFQAEDRGDSTVTKQDWRSWCDPLNPHKKRVEHGAVYLHSQQWRGRDRWVSGAHHGPACSVSLFTNQPTQWTMHQPVCLPSQWTMHQPTSLISRVQASEASNKTKQKRKKVKQLLSVFYMYLNYHLFLMKSKIKFKLVFISLWFKHLKGF